MSYCVYITFYRGNQLPPFYIGSTSIEKIENGYRGSVSSKLYKDIWKSEIQNNPHLFKTVIISEHKTRTEAYQKEKKLQISFNVHKNPMYINKAIGYNEKFATDPVTIETRKKMSYTRKKLIEEGIIHFNHLRNRDVSGLNNPMFGKTHRPESIQKMSETKKGTQTGENNPMFGKPRPDLSERNKQGRIPIGKFDKDFNLLKVYSCAKEAALDIGHKSRANISNLAKNYEKFPNRTIGGFKWKYIT